ncbi:CX domain-containing protein [Aphelenchoides fujianensis]|nr:CX domain-containing protein [Aphelenchoides fujianensis]
MRLNLYLIVFLLLLPVVLARGGGGRGGRGRGRGRSGSRSSSRGRSGSSSRGRSHSSWSRGRSASRTHSIRSFNSNPTFTAGNSAGSHSNAQRFKSSLADRSSYRSSSFVHYDHGVPTIRHASVSYVHGNRNYLFVSGGSPVPSAHHGGHSTGHAGGEARGHAVNSPVDEEFCRLPIDALIDGQEFDQLNDLSHVNETEDGLNSTEPAWDYRKVRSVYTNMSDEDQWLLQLQFENGSRPDEIIWKCKEEEVCCGTECCPLRTSLADNLWILIAVVGLLLTVGFYTYAHLEGYCRDSRNRVPVNERPRRRSKGQNANIAVLVSVVLTGALLVLNGFVFHL